MALTEEQWKEILNAVEFNNNPDDVLEQIKAKLKEQYQDTYQEWKQRNFDVNHLFDVSFNIPNGQISLEHTLLYIAALNGHLNTVKYLVEQRHVDVNQANEFFGDTALHWAAQNGQLNTIKYLVEQRYVDINQVDNHGLTALHAAASNGHLDTVKYLVEQRSVDVNQVDNYGYAALHIAALNGHLNTVKYLAEQRYVDVNQVDNCGDTALHVAAESGHLNTVKYLVEQRHVDVNQIDNDGGTSLHAAASNGHLETVKYLVEQRYADVNQVDNDGFTALHLAASNGYLETIKYLIEQRSVNVNQVDNDGETALHAAASNGHLDTIQYLVEQGNADVNQTNSGGETALHLAAQFDELDVAKFLIAHEVKLNPSDVKKPSYLEHPNSDCAREMSEYWDKCLDEVKKMQEEKIGGDITFYSIWVSKSIDKLACYMRNEQFAKVLERSNYRNKFPIYADDLDYLFKTVKQRVEALNIGEIVIKHFDGLSKGGPAHLHIAEYLSNEDLKNLRKAAIRIMDEEDVSQSLGSDVSVESVAKKQGKQT